MFNKFIILFLTVTVLWNLDFLKVAHAADTLPDIRKHWARSEIELLLSKKIVEGRTTSTGQKLFYPNAKITRAEFIVMLVNAKKDSNSRLKPVKTAYSSYADKNYNKHWAKPFIEAATEVGYTGGRGDGLFFPDEPLTRAELAIMILRASEFTQNKTPEKAFADVDSDLWFNKSLLLARSRGLISGDSNNCFKPFAHASRAEAAAMISRLLYVK